MTLSLAYNLFNGSIYSEPYEVKIGIVDIDPSITFHVMKLIETLPLSCVLVPDPGSVMSYLLDYPELITVVEKSSSRVIERFESTAQYSLEIFTDVETDFQTLQLMVRQFTYQRDLISILDEIQGEFENELRASSGWFILSTDHKNPLP